MKRTITNPYKVNHKIYIGLTAILSVTLICSFFFINSNCPTLSLISDIVKNLSYGGLASTFVAWIIDCANTKKLNQKATIIYDMIYTDLKHHIRFYIGLWAEFCAISFKQSDYYKEEHTWKEWYAIAQKNYCSEPEERQAKLLDAYHSQLLSCVKIINHSIEKIQSQSYVLAVNETMDQQLENILNDLQAEFSTLEKELTSENDANYFWSHTDAIHSNLERRIENWEDIKHYNHKRFKPYKVFNLREP